MKKKTKFSGFSLVELIIVISIIGILSLLAITGYQGYSETARDAVRLSNISTISRILEEYTKKTSHYPAPDNAVSITWSGSVVWYQGTITDSLAATIGLSPVLKDPKYGVEYGYSITTNGKQYQIASVYEGSTAITYSPMTPIPTAIADTPVSAIVRGTYNHVVIPATGLNDVTTFITVPSIILSDLSQTDLSLSGSFSTGAFVVNSWKNLPASYSGIITQSSGDFYFTPKNIGTITGSLSSSNLTTLMEQVKLAYSGSVLVNSTDNTIWKTVTTSTSGSDAQIMMAKGIFQWISGGAYTVWANQTCSTNYTMSGSTCVANTQTGSCTWLPTNASWNTVSSITQTWNGSLWSPTTAGTYNTTPSTSLCNFACNSWYTYNAGVCVLNTPYVDDVFSAYTYTGNGGSQTINNGILLGDGLNLPLGSAIGGGYYMGIDSGYAIIVSPKSLGDSSAYKTYDDAIVWCDALTDGIYSDWYLPTKDQLNLIYTSNDILSAEERLTKLGSGWSGYYRTSISIDADFAWMQYFNDGTQSSYYKTTALQVRAVRKVAVSDPSFNTYRITGHGGMVWAKGRSGDAGATDHALYDTVRGATTYLATTISGNQTFSNGLTSFLSNGYSLGANSTAPNYSNSNYVSWTFRKAPKFFDVVTYSGNDALNRTIAHSLGQTPGMIIVKTTNSSGNWYVWHRSSSSHLLLNTTAAKNPVDDAAFYQQGMSSTTFGLAGATPGYANASGNTYIAYIFAHDTSADGIIQAGSFTTDTSGNASVNLGWEPQFVTIKNVSSVEDWQIHDTARGWTSNSAGNALNLRANLANAESGPSTLAQPTATGFLATSRAASTTFIYLAIRRPNKPPTSGTQVFSASANASTTPITYADASFPADLVFWSYNRNSYFGMIKDRLRGGKPTLFSNATSAEDTTSYVGYFDDMTGFNTDQGTGNSNIWWNFRRASGFFDTVAYTGNGSATTVSHNLGVVPELIITKARNDGSAHWCVYHKDVGINMLYFNGTHVTQTGDNSWQDAIHTNAYFKIGTYNGVNGSADTQIAYLFATLPNISKVGSYTGNWGTLSINAGFDSTARFILIKRTNVAGDWFVWDSARGIVDGSDPHLSLNSTTAEVTTDDSVDPDATGFAVNQVAATNINVSGGTYIYLAVH